MTRYRWEKEEKNIFSSIKTSLFFTSYAMVVALMRLKKKRGKEKS